MMREYCDHLKSKNSSPETLKWYMYKGRIFLEYLESHNIWLITPNTIREYLLHRKEIDQVSMKTIQGDYRALHATLSTSPGDPFTP